MSAEKLSIDQFLQILKACDKFTVDSTSYKQKQRKLYVYVFCDEDYYSITIPNVLDRSKHLIVTRNNVFKTQFNLNTKKTDLLKFIQVYPCTFRKLSAPQKELPSTSTTIQRSFLILNEILPTYTKDEFLEIFTDFIKENQSKLTVKQLFTLLNKVNKYVDALTDLRDELKQGGQ